MARFSSLARLASSVLVVVESRVCSTVFSEKSRMPITERVISSATWLCCWAAVAIWKHYRWVAVAQVPYFIWVSLATVLQLSITAMNW